MIAFSSSEGKILKVLPCETAAEYVLHSLYGIVAKATLAERDARRQKQGLRVNRGNILCRFSCTPTHPGFALKAIEGCRLESINEGEYRLHTSLGDFLVSANVARLGGAVTEPFLVERDRTFQYSFLVSSLLLLIAFIPMKPAELKAPEVLEPVTVNLPVETQKSVKVPEPTAVTVARLESKAQNTKPPSGAQVAQQLGFLSILGKKDLKKAMGGMTTELKEASAGAGAGGTQGSGGELLVGLGQGVKRTTVGNSGVSGLGGVGNKGAGGGAGGFGNSLVGSGGSGTGLMGPGEGKRLSAMALSNDIVLEGGLDSSVIQATIAKYLSQVRACYEEQLVKNPALTGQVTMAFEINGRGALNFSKVARSTLGNESVESCIASRMLSWKFPEPLGGVNVKVSYPFLLRPVRG